MILHQADWCRASGILRPAVLPEDDDLQDAICAAITDIEHRLIDAELNRCGYPDRAGEQQVRRFDSGPCPATADIVGAGSGSDAGSGWTSPRIDGDGAPASVSPVLGRSPESAHVRPAPTPIAALPPTAPLSPSHVETDAGGPIARRHHTTTTPVSLPTTPSAPCSGQAAAPAPGAVSGPEVRPHPPADLEARTPYSSLWAAARI